MILHFVPVKVEFQRRNNNKDPPNSSKTRNLFPKATESCFGTGPNNAIAGKVRFGDCVLHQIYSIQRRSL